MAGQRQRKAKQQELLSTAIQTGIDLHRRGRHAEAERICSDVLAIDDKRVDALHLLSVLKRAQGNPMEAIALLGRALRAAPTSVETLADRAGMLIGLGRHAEALQDCERAVVIKPGHADAWIKRGTALQCLGRLDDSLKSFDKAVALKPDSIEGWTNRGNTLAQLGRSERAVASYDKALAIDNANAAIWKNRAAVLSELWRTADALASYDKALALDPDNPNNVDIWKSRGALLHQAGRYDDALADYRRVLAVSPGHAVTTRRLGMLQLLLGDFLEGWANSESRLQVLGTGSNPLRDAAPQWRGEPISGKTIMLHAEQGLGDTIQFLRYVPMVAATGARAILAVQGALKALAEQVAPQAVVLVDGEAAPPFDLQCPLLSLPPAFATDLDTIPRDVPYVRAAGDRVAAWRNRLPAGEARRVGLVWAGSSTHGNDRNRSIDLARLRPLFDAPGVQFVSLQRELRPGDAVILEASATVTHVGDRLADFADTTAVIECLDVVVTVDTSVAHLAGAMGKPVWILLPFSPDWRWLLGRDDSPWYPTARLFRQPAIDDWESVIARVRAELAKT
jgi:tetratricopeptide (TPR) repeat protein